MLPISFKGTFFVLLKKKTTSLCLLDKDINSEEKGPAAVHNPGRDLLITDDPSGNVRGFLSLSHTHMDILTHILSIVVARTLTLTLYNHRPSLHPRFES